MLHTVHPSTVFTPGVAVRAPGRLAQARAHELAGRMNEAIEAYDHAIEIADAEGAGTVLAESLRRLGNVRRRRNEIAAAAELYGRSMEVARSLDDPLLQAEALNALALVHVQAGEWDRARHHLQRALRLGAERAELRGRIEQNFGVISNIQGDFRTALAHYQRSLEAFRAASDARGCAIAQHNLGMINADQQRWEEADQCYRESLDVAQLTGDVQLHGHILLNRSEVHLARGRFEDARRDLEQALRIFEDLGARDRKASAYRFLGMLYRETGYPELAEARLRGAVELAAEAGAGVDEAEATRELALLYQGLGRNQDALTLLHRSHRLFRRLDARVDLIDVAGKVASLERVYLDVVRQWGRSIESSDSYTFGHSERVAAYAARVGEALGIDAIGATTLRMGAHLHDLGKVRVPHEILNKPSRLTSDEFDVMKRHPLYGLELLAAVEFPWDLKPIIRSHHEKLDGSGYPDNLRGDEIPQLAQIVCAVDVYDALTSTRSYRGAMLHDVALAEIAKSSRWWRGDVFQAFMETVGKGV